MNKKHSCLDNLLLSRLVSCQQHDAHRATVFLFDDTQLVHEAFLEDINGILNTGEVPSLFNNEEMVAINEALTKPAQVAFLCAIIQSDGVVATIVTLPMPPASKEQQKNNRVKACTNHVPMGLNYNATAASLVQAAGINTGSPAEVYAFFIERARTNLHVVLCLSPIGDAFRTRLRMFPSLVNCCTIDW